MEATHSANPVKVRAVQIDSFIGNILNPDGKTYDVLANTIDGTVALTSDMCARYKPAVGDYIVTQEDGYVYVNPKDVFERKYSPLTKSRVEVYSRPECVFNYCAAPSICKSANRCTNSRA